MSAIPPHLFEALTGSASPRTTLLIGAGLSRDLVETPAEIVLRIAGMQSAVEKKIGIASACAAINPAKPNELYRWAGDVFAQLLAAGNSPQQAKLRIANGLGVTTAPEWQAKAKMPLRGNTPRHRVIARLARENRWHAIWSLNWDIWLESALLSVGIENSSLVPYGSELPQAWIAKYKTWVPGFTKPNDEDQTINFVKPHGCVAALLKNIGLFVLTLDELNTALASQPADVIGVLKQNLANKQFLCVGWSAGELYLQSLFKSLQSDKLLISTDLTIVDPYPNLDGHQLLVDCYGTTRDKSIFESKPPLTGSTDDLFYWIQLRHALICLRQPFDPGSLEYLQLSQLLVSLEIPNVASSNWMTFWADNFLPVWTRFCFNSGRVVFHKGPMLTAHSIPTHRRDEHIPWNDQSVDRPDLKAAAQLLLKLHSLGANTQLDTSSFPGGLWNKTTGRLMMPIPAWSPSKPITAGSLKPLASGYQWANHGLISHVDLLPLGLDSKSTLDPAIELNWKAEMASLMRVSKLASAKNVGVQLLTKLKEFS